MKKINIEGIEYQVDCSAWTMFEYRKIFNRSIFDDINLLKKVLATQILAAHMYKEEVPGATEAEINAISAKSTEQELEAFAEALLKITWIFMYTANTNIEEYEKWLKNVKKVNIASDWVSEVTELAVTSFR